MTEHEPGAAYTWERAVHASHVAADPFPVAAAQSPAVPPHQLRRWKFLQDIRVSLQVLPHCCHPIAQEGSVQEALICLWAEALGSQHTVAQVDPAGEEEPGQNSFLYI